MTGIRYLQPVPPAAGSPEIGWVRVVVTRGAENPFTFEEHVVPRWKYW